MVSNTSSVMPTGTPFGVQVRNQQCRAFFGVKGVMFLVEAIVVNGLLQSWLLKLTGRLRRLSCDVCVLCVWYTVIIIACFVILGLYLWLWFWLT